MRAKSRGAVGSLTAFVASAFACQVVLDIDNYEFSPVQEQRLPSYRADSGGEPDADGETAPPLRDGDSLDGGADESSAARDGDAAVTAPDDPMPCDGPACAPDSCDGCRVGELCVLEGRPLPSQPCLLCDPHAASGYSIAIGRACGAEATPCSNEDRCNAEGACAPRDRPLGTPCGDGAGTPCDGVDTCDGAGTCVDRRAGDGTPCDDGSFCTDGDQCQSGQCLAGGARSCAANEQCSEDADACVCPGCVVDGACVLAGTSSGPCLVCDPARSTTGFSANVDAVCAGSDGECFDTRACNVNGECVARPLGAGFPCGDPSASACTGPDSCDGAGNCSPNHALDGTACEDGFACTEGDNCQGGGCASGSEVFCGNGRICNEVTVCDCPPGLIDCFDGTCRSFCDFSSIP